MLVKLVKWYIYLVTFVPLGLVIVGFAALDMYGAEIAQMLHPDVAEIVTATLGVSLGEIQVDWFEVSLGAITTAVPVLLLGWVLTFLSNQFQIRAQVLYEKHPGLKWIL